MIDVMEPIVKSLNLRIEFSNKANEDDKRLIKETFKKILVGDMSKRMQDSLTIEEFVKDEKSIVKK